MRTFIVVSAAICGFNTFVFVLRLLGAFDYTPSSEHTQNAHSLLIAALFVWALVILIRETN